MFYKDVLFQKINFDGLPFNKYVLRSKSVLTIKLFYNEKY